ncbi:cilia- and flagella-associated protein 65 isoform X2 [Kryptolebias marmoratus]|uniref:cilia- and flagella-associated protein 65 isoform X2 n=1 Tax=Kryptolebias marmoratus TaxID=37003 RepID=UPI0018ACADD5|nr:cilia- and flagella-associated protein 65 isoform X2 [Kryptolebias marmoratus]
MLAEDRCMDSLDHVDPRQLSTSVKDVKLEVPDCVRLPLCAVQHSSQTNFLLKNVSKLQTFFEWDCAAQFQLKPEQGLLKPGQACCITVVFQPQGARMYQQQAYCRFGEGGKADNCCTVLLLGLAKYPYLQLQIPTSKEEEGRTHPELHFGSVAVGQSLRKHFNIFNPSPVNVCFSLSRLSGAVTMLKPEFSCDITSAEVAPGGSLQGMVTYSPAVVDTISVEYLSLKYAGAPSETQLKLTGKCIGPRVSLSPCVLDFGCGKEGQSVVQTVELLNSSPAQAIYQWDIDCENSVFSIQPASGTLLPHSRIKLKAVYKPTHPMAHYRRVACLILHRDPLFLDLIGTCHSESQQPEILKPEHLVLYKHHYYHRQNSLDSASQQDQNTHLNQQRAHSSKEETNQNPNRSAVISTTPVEEFDQIIMGHMDCLTSSHPSPFPHVSMVPSELLFNHKIISSSCSPSAFTQFVTIRSQASEKLSLVWTAAQDSSFSVTPTSCDLAPLKSTAFQVTYNPKQLNTLHGGQLECFAYHKDSSNMLCPPCCVTVRVIGHSFQPGKEHFTPSCFLNPSQMVFPALSVISCRTVLLQNNADLPLSFCLNNNSDYASVASMHVQPGCGLIQPGDHQIITIRAIPTEDSPKEGFNLLLQLNASHFTKELTVVSVVGQPSVSLESGSSLCFHPTAVGSITQRTHYIRNLSPLPVQFQWSILEAEQELISVKPDAGELHPNESSIQMWSFSPLAEKTYTLKPTLNFWPIQSDGSNKSHLTLEVTGMGSRGSIETEKEVLDVGKILVGSFQLIEIPLVNNSPCPVSFRLSVQPILPVYDSEEDQSALHLDCETGTIASDFTVLLPSTLRICTQAQYCWDISYHILNTNGLESCPQKLCEVRAKGMYPTLQVVDSFSSGSVGRLSKLHLWRLFSLDSLNEHLLAAPSPIELTFKTPTKHSLHSCPFIFTKVMLDFNFSCAPLNSDPSEIRLMFHNPGSIPVDWAFLLPEDQQIELEDWAVTGEFSSTELYQMKVQDHKLFQVSPHSGTLLPGQKRAVHFSYSHDFIGTNRLPVVFKLSYGREILLNFQGVTVERDKPYLYFAYNRHVFTSVAISDISPPRQMYELYNGGAVPVHYEVDKAVLSQLEVDNFNHPVLCCLNPEGEVSPGKTATLEWIFSPLVAKMYHMDIPIYIQETDSTITVMFEGCGIDASTLSSSNSFTYSDSKAAVHCVQREPFPGQVLFLSEDSVSLGNIPVRSQSSRIFFLTNVSHTDTVHYMWDLPQQRNQQVVQIHPERGCLCPGECTLCVLTFIPTDYPTVYQLDLMCQVIQEAAFAQYCDALRRWEKEKERQQNEFIITDKNISRSQRVLIDEKPLSPSARKGPPLLKYKTLPPIPVSSSKADGSLGVKETRAERRLQREKAKIWRRPQPPEPALLHLCVTAHSHGLLDYFKHFPDQYHKYYRNLQSRKSLQTVPDSAGTSVPARPFTSAHGPDRDIHEHILTLLLRDVLEDSVFVQSLTALASKLRTYQLMKMSSTPRPFSTHSSSPKPHVLCSGTVDREGTEETQATLQPEYAPADMCEVVLMNTFQNLMTEAVRGELVLTAHPQSIILPPLSTEAVVQNCV